VGYVNFVRVINFRLEQIEAFFVNRFFDRIRDILIAIFIRDKHPV